MNKQQYKQLIELLKELHLPMFREYYQEFAQKAMADELGYEAYLYGLAQRECEVRRANKIARLVRASKLPLEKTLQTLDSLLKDGINSAQILGALTHKIISEKSALGAKGFTQFLRDLQKTDSDIKTGRQNP